MEHSTFFIFSNHQLLLVKEKDRYTLPSSNIVSENNILPIGSCNQNACFVINTQSSIAINESLVWVTLRFALENLDSQWQGILSRAYQTMLWDLNHQFCGRCSRKTNKGAEKLEKRCEHCNHSFFPKISPAVIVLIKKGNQILMARKKDFPQAAYGLIAGFSEPGETLEETVRREVYEEVGLHVKNICYTGSQSWPFPDSLMLAFTADYDSGEISLHDHELEKAGWYDYNHLPGKPSSPISIATKMIDDFISHCSKKITT